MITVDTISWVIFTSQIRQFKKKKKKKKRNPSYDCFSTMILTLICNT